jgi:hypothetical protein
MYTFLKSYLAYSFKGLYLLIDSPSDKKIQKGEVMYLKVGNITILALLFQLIFFVEEITL